MHSWVPNELGSMPDDEAEDYWFSEGFNDYLASKVLLRAGLWTLEQWTADKNETLLRYGTSPAKTIAAADVSKRFWTEQAVQQVSYDRGHLLAAMLDAQVLDRTGGEQALEDVLRVQREAAKGSSALARDRFRTAMLEKTGIDATEAIDRFARAGEPIVLPETLLGACGTVVAEPRRAFERGFDAQATRVADGVIAGVDPAGPAHAAGMRNGQRLVRREAGTIGDASVPLSYRISNGGEEKVISYLPVGRTEHQVQRLVLVASGDDHAAACKARLGGKDPRP
jgi:predicted metalloprotease with PDZ domain